MKLVYLYGIIAVLLSTNNFAQQPDSLSQDTVHYIHSWTALPTKFFPHSVEMPQKSVANLGNFNSPAYFFNYSLLGVKEARLLDYTIDSVYHPRFVQRPETYLEYQIGTFAYQKLIVSHVQKLSKSIGVNVQANKTKSTGAFQNQATDVVNLNSSLSWIHPDSTQQIDLMFIHKKKYFQENGGLDSVNQFYNQLFEEPDFYSTRFESASNLLRYNIISSSGRFTIYGTPELEWKAGYHLAFSQTDKTYSDEAVSIANYQNVFLDSSITKDSTRVGGIDDELYMEWSKSKITIGFAGTHSYVDYNQNAIADTIYNNYGVSAYSRYSGNVNGDLSTVYIVDGYNKGNWNIDGSLSTTIDSNITIIGQASYCETTPSYYYRNFYSNHHIWTNYDFSNMSLLKTIGSFVLNTNSWTSSITPQFEYSANYIYFDKWIQPRQLSTDLIKYAVSGNISHRGEKFKLAANILYQGSNLNTVLLMPSYIATADISYKQKIFKHRLALEIGSKVIYYAEYQGFAYAPELGVFYLQDQSVVGNYPFIAPYLTIYIKRATIGLTVKHANSGFMGYRFEQVPGYPSNPRQFIAKISWQLFD